MSALPPLLPVYPVAKAKARLMIYRIEKDWITLLDKIDQQAPDAEQARESSVIS